MPDDQERRQADDARLLRSWLHWHRQERERVLGAPHFPMGERLFYMLRTPDMTSRATLLASVRAMPWSTIDSDTRLTCLHEINSATRERHDLTPFDDGFDARVSVFVKIRDLQFPRNAAPVG